MDMIDVFGAQWAEQRPGIDTEALEVWGRLKRTSNLLEKVLSRVAEENDLSMAEFEVIAALVRQGPPFASRPTELTRAFVITPGAMTARLATLERRGLIARAPDDNDGRVQLVALTAKGLHMFDPALEQLTAACRDILDRMDDDERDRLRTSLRELLTALDSRAKEQEATSERTVSP